MVSIITGPAAAKALEYLVKAVHFYQEPSIQSRGQILKGYANPVFGLPAFDAAGDEEISKFVEQVLSPQFHHPEGKEEEEAAQRRSTAHNQAEKHVWWALGEVGKLGGPAFEALERLVANELSMGSRMFSLESSSPGVSGGEASQVLDR